MASVPMTLRGKANLEAMLKELEDKRPDILKAIQHAREKGDLSENAEYHAARESLGMLEAKINDVQDKLARSQVVDPSRAPRDRVAFGATVTVLDTDTNEKMAFILCGYGEEDADRNRILTTSPVGQGLMLKRVGDEVQLKVPRGMISYRILDITYEG